MKTANDKTANDKTANDKKDNDKKDNSLNMDRRTVLSGLMLGGLGATAGLALTRFEGWNASSEVGSSSANFDQLFTTFIQSLSPTQIKHTVLSSEHPTRQVTLTQAVHKGPHIGTLYSGHQIAFIRAMYQHLLSSQGQRWMHNTINFEGRFAGSHLKIYSQDVNHTTAENSQLVINGGHYMLRSNDLVGSGYALGGPISYGQQLGNNKYQVKGNAFKAHGDALNEFHKELSQSERLVAYQDSAPYELLLQTQGDEAVIPGVRIGSVSQSAKEVAHNMLNTIFAGFSAEQQAQAWSALDENGGIDSLHVSMFRDRSFYKDGATYSDLNQEQQNERGLPYVQVWRIEGPALVIHFKGYPHVHAYMNIVRDPSKIALGKSLTEIRGPLDQHKTGSLITSILKQRTKQAFAFYPESLLGRLSPGIISTGSIYTLDPFGNKIVIADVAPETMSKNLLNSLVQQGAKLEQGQRYRIATVDYMLAREDLFGAAENVVYTGETVRDRLIDFLTDKDMGELFV